MWAGCIVETSKGASAPDEQKEGPEARTEVLPRKPQLLENSTVKPPKINRGICYRDAHSKHIPHRPVTRVYLAGRGGRLSLVHNEPA